MTKHYYKCRQIACITEAISVPYCSRAESILFPEMVYLHYYSRASHHLCHLNLMNCFCKGINEHVYVWRVNPYKIAWKRGHRSSSHKNCRSWNYSIPQELQCKKLNLTIESPRGRGKKQRRLTLSGGG